MIIIRAWGCLPVIVLLLLSYWFPYEVISVLPAVVMLRVLGSLSSKRITLDEVLTTLDQTEWKTRDEIAEEIRIKRQSPFREAEHLYTIKRYLELLEKDGLVESRSRWLDADRPKEYRRTYRASGIHNRPEWIKRWFPAESTPVAEVA